MPRDRRLGGSRHGREPLANDVCETGDARLLEHGVVAPRQDHKVDVVGELGPVSEWILRIYGGVVLVEDDHGGSRVSRRSVGCERDLDRVVKPNAT